LSDNFRTTDETLKEYVTKFGEVSDSLVMKDQNGQSRCFGFVTFTDPQTIDQFMQQRPHTLDGRQIDPKRASNERISSNCLYVFFSMVFFKCHVKKPIMMKFI
jgi:RNA recognition motif-containing protein